MAISNFNGISISNIASINGISISNIASINRQTISSGDDPFESATVIIDGEISAPIGTSQTLGTEEYYVIETQVLMYNNIYLTASDQHPEMTWELYDSSKTLVDTWTTTSGTYWENHDTGISRYPSITMPYYIKITYNEDSIYNSWTLTFG